MYGVHHSSKVAYSTATVSSDLLDRRAAGAAQQRAEVAGACADAVRSRRRCPSRPIASAAKKRLCGARPPAKSQTHAATTPPGRVTRTISRAPAAASVMKCTTSSASVASNVSSSKGRCSATPWRMSAHGMPRGRGGDEALGGIDARDLGLAEAPRELLGEGAGPAADVERASRGGQPGALGEERGEGPGVPAHEAVVRLCGDVERHGRSLRPAEVSTLVA